MFNGALKYITIIKWNIKLIWVNGEENSGYETKENKCDANE
jgi:hypothetical protein